jgi:branched-chain amino acid transport system ATP-binding protein
MGDRAYILESGKVALTGKCKDLMDNEKVQKVYLGASD